MSCILTRVLHYVGLIQQDEFSEPVSVVEELEFSHWKETMNKEFKVIVHDGTWQLIPYKGQNVVDCKWVFNTKLKLDGSLKRHKARLVAKGFQQDFGVNVGEMFSPIAKTSIIRIFSKHISLFKLAC